MKDERDVLEDLMNSDEAKNAQVQMFLALIISSIILVFKNSILNNNGFVWSESLALSGTAFVLFFMVIFKNKVAYAVWKSRFLEPKRACFFTLLGLVGMLMIVGFDWIMRFLNAKPNVIDFGIMKFDINILTQKPLMLIGDFFSYMFFSMFLLQAMIPPILWCINKIENEL